MDVRALRNGSGEKRTMRSKLLNTEKTFCTLNGSVLPLGEVLRGPCELLLPLNDIFRRSTRKGTRERELDQYVNDTECEREGSAHPL
jgi:hypothetical protein